MLKRIVTLLLVVVIISTNIVIPQEVKANDQIQVKSFEVREANYIVGQDYITGKTVIRPTITLAWEDPDSWDVPEEGVVHDPEFYNITVVNKTLNKTNIIPVNVGTLEYTEKKLNVHDKMNLDTGCFYEFSIAPMHYHTQEVNGQETKKLATVVGTPLKAYAITDLTVDLKASSEEITVIWDKVEDRIVLNDMQYRIIYAAGDFKTKEEVVNNKDGDFTITPADEPEGLSEFTDASSKRKKFQYTLNGKIYPGQIYSVIVEPILDYYGGNAVQTNRNMPNINTCSTNVKLNIMEEGNYVRLSWNVPANFKVGNDSEAYTLTSADLYEYANGQARIIASFNNAVTNAEYYMVPKSDKEVSYQIKFKYTLNNKTIEPVSDIVSYVPSEMRIKPTQPNIPKPISEGILNELEKEYEDTPNDLIELIKKDYLLEGDNYTGETNDLFNLERTKTFQVDDDKNIIKLVFAPFKRKNIDTNSATYGSTIVDSNVYYDIYVTKNLEDMATAIKIIDNKKFILEDETSVVVNENTGKVIGYRVDLSKYYDADKQELQNIKPNELYYIKVVAVKKWGDIEEKSEPKIVSIYYDYEGDVFSPPTIADPPLKIKKEENTQITLEWKESWYEIIAENNGLTEWANELWLKTDGTISTTKVSGAKYFPVYQGEEHAVSLKSNYESNQANEGKTFEYIIRDINLGTDSFGQSDIKYKLFTIPYTTVKNAIKAKNATNPNYNIDNYIGELFQKDQDGTVPIEWEDIKPTYNENQTINYTKNGLLPNVQYLFLLYPYREGLGGELLYAHYPSAIVGKTSPVIIEPTPNPTVPNLYVTGYTDMTATLTWKYNKDFTYEIVGGNVEDISKAKNVPITLPSNPKDPKYPTDGAYYDNVANNLFPNTQYYFWIRAKHTKTEKISSWSNPVIVTTKDVSLPQPPEGVGIASLESLKKYNFTTNQGDNFLTLEWILDNDDKLGADKDNEITKSVNYIVEMADNTMFIEPLYIELSDGSEDKIPSNVEKLSKNLIKINDLTANRKYYFRLKTKVTVKGKDNTQSITKTSQYFSKTVALITLPNGKEYDSDNNTLVTVPYDNYEQIYNQTSKELTYRFKFDGTSQNGDFDQYVSERLITDLIKQNVYEYSIDLSNYSYGSVTKRNVEIPYRVLSAFEENDIELVINTDKSTLIMQSNALDSYIKQYVALNNEKPTIKISITDSSKYSSNLSPTIFNKSLTVPQDITIKIITDKKQTNVEKLNTPITLKLNVINKDNVVNKPVDVMYYNNYEWIPKKAVYNSNDNTLDVSTNQLGVFYGKASQLKTPSFTHWANSYKTEVYNKIAITSINDNNLNDKISKMDYLNILYNLMLGEHNINLSTKLSDEDIAALKKAKILTNDGTTLTRQEALDMIVKVLMQIKGKSYNYSQESMNYVNQDKNINSNYKKSLAIAIDKGFITNPKNIRPKDELTMGEMYVLLSNLLKY